MTKFEMMFVIYGTLHLFFELAIFGALSNIGEVLLTKEERRDK